MRKNGALAAAILAVAGVAAAPAQAGLSLPPPLTALLTLRLPDFSTLFPLQLGTSASTHGPDSVKSLGVLSTLELPGPRKLLHAVHLRSTTRNAASVRQSLPTRWCGVSRTRADTTHQFHNGAHRYHAIYVHAADAPDRLASLATGMQTDLFQASALIERDYGRAIRLDLGTPCGRQYLDITDLTLPQTTAELQQQAATTQGSFDTVGRDIDAAGFKILGTSALQNPDNYIVWLDGPGPPSYCGQGTAYADTRRDASANINARGGKLALIYRLKSGFCDSNGLRHEIGHNLGAVQSPASVGGHCRDAEQDTMCVSTSPSVSASEQPLFDYRDDDYWDPKGAGPLGWWTVDLSPFICSGVACNVVRAPAHRRSRARTHNQG